MTKDPVCGMVVDPTKAAATTEYKGKTYYFCTSGCKSAFERGLEKFVDQTKTDPESSQRSVPGGK